MMKLPPFLYVAEPHEWRECLTQLQKEPSLGIDLEANSMFAYRESVCLIQVSTPTQDYIIDPTAGLDLEGLGKLIAEPSVEKIFHAAEYDLILLKRQYDWELNNLFDTMWAARILGYQRFGLASLLEELFQVRLNKRYQKSNWCRRPLSAEQLAYAQHDTHFLFQLRDRLAQEIEAGGFNEEARELFIEQTQVKLNDNRFDPESFWSIHGARDLTRRQQAILREINIYRDWEAKRRDQPLFKIFNDRTLVELARHAPSSRDELAQIHGMTRGQQRRYGRSLLQVIAQGKKAPLPVYTRQKQKRPSDIAVVRFDKLRQWRKERAQQRGVESDVIISKGALWEIACKNPQSKDDLDELDCVGSYRCSTYGEEILHVLREAL